MPQFTTLTRILESNIVIDLQWIWSSNESRMDNLSARQLGLGKAFNCVRWSW